MQKGKFIIFEGMDYSGKTTLLRSLCKILDSRGINYITTREPGGTKVAENIRRVLLDPAPDEPSLNKLEQAALFQVARSHHCRTVITPALEAGTWVISDRYIISSLVYQNNAKDTLEMLTKQFGILEPDFMFYARCGYETTLKRKGNRGVDNYMDELYTKHYHEYSKLFDYYACLLEDMSLTLDTNKSPDALSQAMEDYVDKILGEQNV